MKESREHSRDPAKEKAKDNARQRKIRTNSSDKASRKNAPLVKAMANREVRRNSKVDIETEENADAILTHHKAKRQHWGSFNASLARSERDDERAILDDTAGELPKGRGRAYLHLLLPERRARIENVMREFKMIPEDS